MGDTADKQSLANTPSRRGSGSSIRSMRSAATQVLLMPTEVRAAALMGPSFAPESVGAEDLEDCIQKLRDANYIRHLENQALREYLMRRRPADVRSVEEKYVEMLRRAMYLFRRPPSQIADLLPPQSGSQQSVATIQSEAQSITSTASTESLASVSALEMKERLPLSDRLTIVRITTQLARERLMRVRAGNEQRLRKLQYLTQVTEAQVEDAEDTVRIHETVLHAAGSGHLCYETLAYHVGKVLRDKDQALQLMSMERGRMTREAQMLVQTLARRRELVKELHPVDWDKLRIVNETHRRNIEAKTAQWIAARKTVGYIGLDVHELQRRVARARARGKWVTGAVESKMTTAQSVLNELPYVKRQADRETAEVIKKKALLDKYEAPLCYQYTEDCAALARAECDAVYYRRNLPIRKVMLRNAYRRLVRLDKTYHEVKHGPGRAYEVPEEIRSLLRRPIEQEMLMQASQVSFVPSRVADAGAAESPLGSWHSLSRSERALLAAASAAACDAEVSQAQSAAAPEHWATAAAVTALQERSSLLRALRDALPDAGAGAGNKPADARRPRRSRVAAPSRALATRSVQLRCSVDVRGVAQDLRANAPRIV